jgi:hypothetical protein
LKSAATGLSGVEARFRLDDAGRNGLATSHLSGPFRQIFKLVLNPLVIILLIASGISVATPVAFPEARNRPQVGV